MRKIVCGVIMAIILMGTLTFNIKLTREQWTGTIYIKNDGSIDPPAAPIQRDGNLYTFTADINGSVVVLRDNIVIDGAGYTLQGPGYDTGILLPYRGNVTVRNVQIKNFFNGVELYYSSNNNISQIKITESWVGILLVCSSNNILSRNDITNNLFGIQLSNSSNNIISGNEFINDGLSIYDSYNNVIENNSVNGKPLIYLEGKMNCRVSDAGQVILVNCNGIWIENLNLSQTDIGVQLWKTDNCVISRNSLMYNTYGIQLLYSSNNIISGNNISGDRKIHIVWNRYGVELLNSSNNVISENNIAYNTNGIQLLYSSNNIISGNNLTVNSWSDVYFYYSSNNVVRGNNMTSDGPGISLSCSSNNFICRNNVEGNAVGVELSNSSNNWIFHNNFIYNIYQVSIGTFGDVNFWDDGYPSGGNYWSDYTGVDLCSGPNQDQPGSDGIGDTPYILDENNVDRYPLMYPFVLNMTSPPFIEILGAKVERISNSSVIIGTMNVTMFSRDIYFYDVLCELSVTAPYGMTFISDIWTTIYNGTMNTIAFPNITLPYLPTGFYGYRFRIIDPWSGNTIRETRYCLKYIVSELKKLIFWHFIPANSPYTEDKEYVSLQCFDEILINMVFTDPCKYFMFNMTAWGDYEIRFLDGGVPVVTRYLSFTGGESRQLFLYSVPPANFSISIRLTSQKGYIWSFGMCTGPKMDPLPGIKVVSAECLNKFGIGGGNATFDVAYAWNITSRDEVLIEILYGDVKIGETRKTVVPFLSDSDEVQVSAQLPNTSGDIWLTVKASLVHSGVSNTTQISLKLLPSIVGISAFSGPFYLKSAPAWQIWNREYKVVTDSQLEALDVDDIKVTEVVYDENANPVYAKVMFNARNKYKAELITFSIQVHYAVGIGVNVSGKKFVAPLGLLLSGDSAEFQFFTPVTLEYGNLTIRNLIICYYREINIGVVEIITDLLRAVVNTLLSSESYQKLVSKVSLEDLLKCFALYLYAEFYSGDIPSASLDHVAQKIQATETEKGIMKELLRRGFTKIQSALAILDLRREEGKMSPLDYIWAFATLFTDWLSSDTWNIMSTCLNKAIMRVAPGLVKEIIWKEPTAETFKLMAENAEQIVGSIFSALQSILTSIGQLIAPNCEAKWIYLMNLGTRGVPLTVDPVIRVYFNMDLSQYNFNASNIWQIEDFQLNISASEAFITVRYNANMSSVYGMMVGGNYADYILSSFNFNASAIEVSNEPGYLTVHALGRLMGDCRSMELEINQTAMTGCFEGSLAAWLQDGHFTINKKLAFPFGNEHITSVYIILPQNSTVTGASPEGFVISNSVIAWNMSIDHLAVNFTAPTDIRISRIVVPGTLTLNKEAEIQVTVENNGSFPLAIEVGLNYTRTADPLIGIKTVILNPGESINISFTWIPLEAGRYRLLAYTGEIPDDIKPDDNMLEITVYVSYQQTSGGSRGSWRFVM